MRQHLNRYLGMALAALLVLAAVFAPSGWFALRDAAFADYVQGEELSPLIVAQLDHGYERDIHERLSVCLAAVNSQDVMCSSKGIDPDSESLWDNIAQAEESTLMGALNWSVAMVMAKETGWPFSIESCVQYALMRKSDGQILLVANDIRLSREDGCWMELLLDGVDGTVYYLESEDAPVGYGWKQWNSDRATQCWEWWQILNDVYDTEELRLTEARVESGGNEMYSNWETNTILTVYDSYDGLINLNELAEEEIEFLDDNPVLCLAQDGRVKAWFYARHENVHAYTYCGLLAFGELADCWTMEVETPDQGTFQQIRLGMPWIIRVIPEMSQRISLAEYRDIYQMDKRAD